MTTDRRRAARAYLGLQSVSVVLWWIVIARSPTIRPLFEIAHAPLITLFAFAPADLVLVAGGSALVAWRPDLRWGAPVAWMVAGALLYAASYTTVTWLTHDSGPLAAALMVPASLASIWAAAAIAAPDALTADDARDRRAPPVP